MVRVRYPLLYQVNTRVCLAEISRTLGRPATLDDIPDIELDRLAGLGFDWLWFLSVWQTGMAAQRVSRTNRAWRDEFSQTLPDLKDEDVPGSGFAITGYQVHTNLGGDAALARLRERLRKRGLKLMLDFVPNHMGLITSGLRITPNTLSPERNWISPAIRGITRGSSERTATCCWHTVAIPILTAGPTRCS